MGTRIAASRPLGKATPHLRQFKISYENLNNIKAYSQNHNSCFTSH